MKLNLLLSLLPAFMNCAYAQNSDSLNFAKEFKSFFNKNPFDYWQTIKYDSLTRVLRYDKSEVYKKNLELLSVINKIEKGGLYSLQHDKSGLVSYSTRYDKAPVVYTNQYVNLFYLEEIADVDIERQYPRFYKLAKNKDVLVYGIYNNTFEVGYPAYHIKGTKIDTTGLDLPEIIWSSKAESSNSYLSTISDSMYKQSALTYWNVILNLLPKYNCVPKLLEYYKAQEAQGDSWMMLANKRRRFIDYIKVKCPKK